MPKTRTKLNKMNILFIMTDSLAPHFISVYGDKAARTPNLDALARNGVTFKNAYCNSPICAPSRASLITGRYISEIGCFDNASEFSTEWPTIGHILGAAAYETPVIGKMHFVGCDQWHGFDRRIAFETDYTQGHDPDYFKLAYDWEQPSEGNPVGHDWMGPSHIKQKKWDNYPVHFNKDEQIHQAALEYLAEKDAASDPFFCCVSYHAPHNPFWIPEQFRAEFKDQPLPIPMIPEGVQTCHGPMDKWLNDFHYVDEIQDRLMEQGNLRWLYETFYGMVFDVDRRIGELLTLLENQGLSRKTAIIFTGDHGDMMGHRGMIQKRYFYERSVRIPLIFSFPGHWKQETRLAAPVSLIDLLPTFAELTEAPLPDDLPGTSLMPSLEMGSEPAERTIFCEYHGEGVHAPCFMAVWQNYKYIYVHKHEERLYDVKNDPYEFHNLIDEKKHSNIISKMKQSLCSEFDPEKISEAALQSQRNRRFIYNCFYKWR
jgi:choline-sulfatase